MRKKITECNDEHVLNELKDSIKHCLKSTVVCSLRQSVISENGRMNTMNMQQVITDKPRCRVQIKDNRLYLNIEFEKNDIVDMLKIENIWNMMLARSSENFMNNRENDAVMVIELVGMEQMSNLAYVMAFYDPVFLAKEEARLKLVYDISNLNFGIENVDYIEILQEIDYENEIANKEKSIKEDGADLLDNVL